MKLPQIQTTHTIDAAEKKLGRIASEAAAILLGKGRTDFEKHTIAPTGVTIKNASKLIFSEKKKDQKTYTHYSGYPGGLKEETLALVLEKKGFAEAVRRAIYGMLPKNKLRDEVMKHVTIEE